MSDVARYFHTSLYAFNQQARSAVVNTFNEVIQDVAVRCWYDAAQETFLIESPTGLGSVADEALTTIIMKYIEKELDDAEIEEREPNILRFPESRFDALDSFLETEQHKEDGEEDLASAAPLVSGRPSVTHLVIVGPAEGKVLKLFRLDELTGDLLERTLAPFNERAQRIVNDGLTCRAVRWVEEKGRHVFNGRTGTERTAIEAQLLSELELPTFGPLQDTRTLDTESDRTSVKTWVHVGEAPTVEKWVRGIGETRQIDPEEKGEMPKDARNLIAAANSYAIGRVRVPKGGQVLDDESNSETSEDDRPAADAFDKLLSGQTGSIDGSGDGSDFDGGHDNPEPAFADLLGPSGSKQVAASTRHSATGDWNTLTGSLKAQNSTRPAAAPPVPARQQPDALQSRAASAQQHENFPPLGTSLPSRRQTPLSTSQPESDQSPRSLPRQRALTKTSQGPAMRQRKAGTKDEDSFPSYGKEFTGVDPQGFHAPAAATARWQIENYEEMKPKPKRKHALLRQREISGSGFSPASTDNSTSGQRDSQTGIRGSSADSGDRASGSTLVNNSPAQADPQWVNTIVQPRVRSGRLVDDRARLSDRVPKAPPGLHAPKIVPKAVAEMGDITLVRDGRLIDVMDDDLLVDLPRQPAITPGNMRTPLVPTPSTTAPTPHQGGRSDADDGPQDRIVERVQALPANYATKRNTMRQKASKKHKPKNTMKIGGKCTAKKVELPLPSPPPPPKPKPVPEVQAKEKKSHTREPAQQPQKPAPLPAFSITNEAHTFGQALLDIRNSSIYQPLSADVDVDTAHPPSVSIKLACQIGVILLHGLDKSLSNRTIEPELLQHKLNATSGEFKRDLFSRVTTSNIDAKELLELMSKDARDLVVEVFYDVIIRDDAGAFLTITIPAGDKDGFTIKSQDQLLTEACAHFPTRVWDARYTLLRAGSEVDTPASKAVKDFVASMQSGGEAPCFQANVSIGVFTLERVLAKRVFSQTADNITAKVMQVQDLLIEPYELKHHNIRVTALPEDLMMDQDRLWWEASWETSDLASAEELQSRVSELVCSIDHIGFENHGPLERSQEVDEPEPQALDPNAILW